MTPSAGSGPLSWLLVAAGACALFLGARDWVQSRTGQSGAGREYERKHPPARPSANLPPDHVAGRPRAGETVARIVIPRLNAELYVVEGVGSRELRRGPGHLPGSALPGDNGNCIVAGHRDTHFRVLKDVRPGDDILLDTPGGAWLYRVRRTSAVSPEDKTALRETSGARLNLITCYPFHYVGPAPLRFVVEAELAGAAPRARLGS